MSGKLISRHCQQYRVHVADYRLLFATPEQRAVVLHQIEKRSRAAKAGWAKRRVAQGIEAGTDETPKSGSVAKPRKPGPEGMRHE